MCPVIDFSRVTTLSIMKAQHERNFMPRIAIIGDMMLDTYHTIEKVRPAPEGDYIYRIIQSEHKPGAAANVAACLRQLGWDITLYGHIGDDPASLHLIEWAETNTIATQWYPLFNQCVRSNIRYMLHGTCVLRVDGQNPSSHWRSFSPHSLSDYDAVILYDKGSLSHIAEDILDYCHRHAIKTYVDPYRGHLYYSKSYVLKANYEEIRYLNPHNMDLHKLKTHNQWQHCIITHDVHPVEYWNDVGAQTYYSTTSSPDTLHPMGDPIGAGDAFLSGLVTAEMLGKSLHEALPYAILAGALAVQHRGTHTPTQESLGLS